MDFTSLPYCFPVAFWVGTIAACGGTAPTDVSPASQTPPNTPLPAGPTDPGPGTARPKAPQGHNPNGPPQDALSRGDPNAAALPQPTLPAPPEAPAPRTDGCDAGMVRFETAQGPACIHQYEVSVSLRQNMPGPVRQYIQRPDLLRLDAAPGKTPTAVSFNEAKMLCSRAGYHLCTSEEWADACDGLPGEGGDNWATLGDTTMYQPGTCNFTHTMQGGMRDLAPSGSYPWCRSKAGVFDLLGNIWEWSDPGQVGADGRPIIDKRGGAHYSRQIATCGQAAVGSHPPDWIGSVGFRCCAAAKTSP